MSATFSVLKTEQQFTEENDSGRGASVIFGNFPGDARAPRTDIPEKISRAESQGQEEDSSGAPAKPDRLRDQTERFLEQAAPYLTRHQEQIIAAAARGLDAKGVAECRYYLGRASLIADSAPEPAGPGSPVLDLVQGYVETSRLEPLQMEIILLLARGYDARTIGEAGYLLARVRIGRSNYAHTCLRCPSEAGRGRVSAPRPRGTRPALRAILGRPPRRGHGTAGDH